ncbi:DUF2715 domain-containing protein [Treponema phagedenis]|uniref:DUF2715 domain-containing protein n=1 Tax=Treponema phagedenis TaxID=162 RepID=UPI0011E66C71|nr:DUF2715 domain-containing protein [Treponema phagedenis]QEK01809.1 DUF2715 domain-containing protein [Treponema phagedenis]QEK06922.1 DUF2715 domain-containing protein [Treponema phagedenis]
MKKAVFFCLLLSAVFTTAFGQEEPQEPKEPKKIEFLLSPTVGLSDIEMGPISVVNANVGLDAGLITKSGFTVMANNHVLIGGALKYSWEGEKFKAKMRGVAWLGTLLFGYSYRGVKNLYIHASGGIGIQYGGFGSTAGSEESVSFGLLNLSFPAIRLAAQYYFTDLIGINIGLEDAVGWGYNSISGSRWLCANTFTLKVGPSFRL